METKPKLWDLLTKFSHASNITKHFGDYYDWQSVLSLLNKRTRQMWIDYKNAFVFLLATEKFMEYHQDFDQQFCDFIWHESLYKSYTLRIKISTPKQIQIFLNFIKNLEYPETLKFTEIKIHLSKENFEVDLLNSLFDALTTRGISTEAIRLDLPVGLQDRKFQDSLQYTSILNPKRPIEITYFKKIRTLDHVFQEPELFEEFLGLKIEVIEIFVTSRCCEHVLKKHESTYASESLQRSVEKLTMIQCEQDSPSKQELLRIFPVLESVFYDFHSEWGMFRIRENFEKYVDEGSSFGKHKKTYELEKTLKVRNEEPVVLSNVNVYFYNIYTKSTTAFHVETLIFNFVFTEDSILCRDGDFMTIKDFSDANYLNTSKFNDLELEEVTEYLKVHPLSEEWRRAAVIEYKDVSLISGIPNLLILRPRNLATFTVNWRKMSKLEAIEDAMKVISELPRGPEIRLTVRVNKILLETVIRLLKMNISRLTLIFQRTDICVMSFKERFSLIQAIVSNRHLKSFHAEWNKHKNYFKVMNLKFETKEYLSKALENLFIITPKKVPKGTFLNEIEIYNQEGKYEV